MAPDSTQSALTRGPYRIPILAPCAGCAHENVCAIKGVLEAERYATLELPVLLPSFTPLAVATRHVMVDCSEFLERVPAGDDANHPAIATRPDDPDSAQSALGSPPPPVEVAPTARVGQPDSAESALIGPPAAGPAMAPYMRRIVDALVATRGDRRAASDRLGIKPVSLAATLSTIRKRSDLTAGERAVVGRRRGVHVIPERSAPPVVRDGDPAAEFAARRDAFARAAADRTWRQTHPEEAAPATA